MHQAFVMIWVSLNLFVDPSCWSHTSRVFKLCSMLDILVRWVTEVHSSAVIISQHRYVTFGAAVLTTLALQISEAL